MKRLILVLKGLLLYTTILAVILLVGGVDSLYDNGYLMEAIIIVAILIYLCHKMISKEERDTVLGNKFLKRWTNDNMNL